MIYINGKPFDIEQASTLMDVLDKLKVDAFNGMAVAVNNNVIPREKWDVFQVNNNDKILVIKAAQGG